MQYQERTIIKPKNIKFSDLPIKNIGREKETCGEVYQLAGGLDADTRLSFRAHNLQRKNEVFLESGEMVSDVWVRNA